MVQIIMDKIEMFNLMPPSKPLPFTIPTQDTLETPQDNRSKLIKEVKLLLIFECTLLMFLNL
jgi:hypothetical protein